MNIQPRFGSIRIVHASDRNLGPVVYLRQNNSPDIEYGARKLGSHPDVAQISNKAHYQTLPNPKQTITALLRDLLEHPDKIDMSETDGARTYPERTSKAEDPATLTAQESFNQYKDDWLVDLKADKVHVYVTPPGKTEFRQLT